MMSMFWRKLKIGEFESSSAVRVSSFVFKIKLFCFGYFDWINTIFLVKINNFQGDLTDISAKTKTLVCRSGMAWKCTAPRTKILELTSSVAQTKSKLYWTIRSLKYRPWMLHHLLSRSRTGRPSTKQRCKRSRCEKRSHTYQRLCFQNQIKCFLHTLVLFNINCHDRKIWFPGWPARYIGCKKNTVSHCDKKLWYTSYSAIHHWYTSYTVIKNCDTVLLFSKLNIFFRHSLILKRKIDNEKKFGVTSPISRL